MMRAKTMASVICLLGIGCAGRAFAADCNTNAIEDVCDISCGTTGGVCDLPGCGGSTDCNTDGIPDDCQLAAPFSDASGALSPIGGTAPQSYVVVSPPLALGDVTLDFSARADFGNASEFINVDINGTPLGTVFQTAPQCSIASDQLVITAATYNAVVSGGDAVIHMVPTSSVSTTLCASPFVSVTVSYSGDGDCNNNGLPSECDIAAGTSADCNFNGLPDECELDCNNNGKPDSCDISAATSGDCNADDIPDECNIAAGTSDDCNANELPDECELAAGTAQDCNANVVLDECDIAGVTSIDCQPNGVPDECEADCNANGVEDGCELAAGSSGDCNTNGVPDECDDDCNANGVADECELTAGSSSDCNTNGYPDECDISGSAIGETLYGVERDSPALYIIDPQDGSLTLVANMDQNIDRAFGLSIDPVTRQMYAVVTETVPALGETPPRMLARVDRDTAQSQLIGPLSEPLSDIAFCDDGTLYGVVGNSSGISGEIVVIDKSDASLSTIGVFGSSGGGQSIACQEGARVLFHTFGDPKVGTDLETIDITTGGLTPISTLSAFGGYNALTFVPAGDELLTYSFGDLYRIDPVTGDEELVDSGPVTITGMAFFFGASGDCNFNTVPDECEIAAGTAQDCDLNNVPDECDPDCNSNGAVDACEIAAGSSEDCNVNGIPDECEFDCNSNGAPDDCDLAAGSSLDTNANNVPDECEFIDCNSNGAQDSDDIAFGTSADCNADGIPDDCELAPGITFGLFGVERDSAALLSIDPADGSTTVIGIMDQQIDWGVGMSIHPQTAELYAILQISGGANARLLATVDKQTAAVNVIGTPTELLSEIAFRADGVLFGVAGNGASNPGEIFEVSTADGTLTSTGIIRGNGGGQSIAFQPVTGNLFHEFGETFPGGTLSIVDLNTGGITVVTTSLTPFNVNAMTFASRDTLLAWESDSLYQVEPDTGVALFRGSGPRAITGVAALAVSNGDCNTNGTPDGCDIAAGTSPDCNGNSIPDGCDIAAGLSADGDGDGVPDECGLAGDCDGNGLIDLADFPQLPTCMSGPNGGVLPPGCDCADIDGDGDVDLEDFARFQLAFP